VSETGGPAAASDPRQGAGASAKIRGYCITPFVTRQSEKPEGKEVGAKGPEAWLDATLRTFCAGDEAIGLRSRPQ